MSSTAIDTAVDFEERYRRRRQELTTKQHEWAQHADELERLRKAMVNPDASVRSATAGTITSVGYDDVGDEEPTPVLSASKVYGLDTHLRDAAEQADAVSGDYRRAVRELDESRARFLEWNELPGDVDG